MATRLKFKSKPRQQLRADLYRAADFTCQECGWRYPDPPEQYDGRQALYVKEPTGKQRYWHVIGRYVPDTKLRGLEIDHINPWSISRDNSRENLQVLCTPCNVRKHNKVAA